MKNLKILSALSILGAMQVSGAYHMGSEVREVPKDDSNRKKIYETSKQGQQVFTYPDGFSCSALNKKSADKKHNRWLKSNGN